MMKHLDTKEFDELITTSDLPVVCDFWATWCGPCRMLGPVLEKLSEKWEGKAVFVKVDIDDNEDLAVRYQISSIPLVCIFKKGQVTASSLGFKPEAAMNQFIEANISR